MFINILQLQLRLSCEMVICSKKSQGKKYIKIFKKTITENAVVP